MAKIPLAIDRNYCAGWGVYEGIREYFQNAKDADEDGYTMTIEHFPRTARLVVTNADIYVDPSRLLILGKSDKSPGEKRGQFGEGFVLGTLALLRKGHDVKFTNGDLSWSVSFEQPDVGHPFEGQELLTFKSRKLGTREQNFKVEIDNIPTEVWVELKKLFLFLDPPKTADIVEMSQGTLLLAEARKGQVFSRGIFVRVFEDLACGYDMKHLNLDRDRRMVDEWELHYKLGSLWQEACAQKPLLAAPRVYAMAKENAAEVRQLKYHADAKLLKHVQEQFTKENGEDASPVTTMAAADAAAAVGAKPVIVSSTLQELLDKSGLSPATVAARMEGTVEARFSPGDLSEEERRAVARIGSFLPSMAVVAFRGTKAACRLLEADQVVGVERRLLTAPFKELLSSALNAEAKRRSVQPLDILLEHVARDAEAPFEPEAFGTPGHACDECGALTDMSGDHKDSCSLYPHNDVTAETTSS